MKSQRSSTSTFVVLIATIVVVAVGGGLLKEYRSSKVSFESLLLRASMEVNKTCPIMVGEDARLDYTMAGPGNVFEYYFTLVNLSAVEIDEAKLDRLLPSILGDKFQNNKELDIFKENNVTIIFNIKNKDGVTVSRIEIDSSEYDIQQPNK